MGDSHTGHTLTKKPSRIFSAEREVPHIRLADESALDLRYAREEKLGQGTFGIVYKGTNVDTKEVVAIKVVNRDKAGSAGIKLLEREIGILKTVSHESIIRLNEVYETQSKIFLIMEFCDRGELSDLLRVSKRMDESTVKIILKRLAAAMAYLHINGIVHRDLKMENILVCTNPSDPIDQFFIKVTDFGLSVVRGGMGPESMLSSFCGTPAYMAPEIIQNKSYSESCDNWAIGCITFALLTGQLPFYSKDDEKLYDAIKSSEPDWYSLPKGTSNDAKHCLRKLLSKDPASRMTAGELLRHPWITGEAGSATPNVLDLMHDFLQQNIKDDEDILEEPASSEPAFHNTKENETKTASRSSSNIESPGSGNVRLIIGGSPVREPSAESSVHNDSSSGPGSGQSKHTNTIKKSPSDHDFDNATSQQTASVKKHNVFDSSLPASSGKAMFSNPRNQSAAVVSTPRQTSMSKGHSNNLPVPKVSVSSHSSSSSISSKNGSSGNLMSTANSKSKKS